MPPTPLPSVPWAPVHGLTPLTFTQGVELAERLPVEPWFVIPYSGLHRGTDRAFASGPLENPDAVIVQHRDTPDEPEYFGRDAEAAWSILSRIPGWFCVNGPTDDLQSLSVVLRREIPLAYRWLGDLFYTLETPPVPCPHPDVRLLDVTDIPLLQRFGPAPWGNSYRTYEELLTEGAVAAGIIDGRVVATAIVTATNPRYADIGVHTLEPYRRRGLSAAAVSLVAGVVQSRGLIPIWSTGSHNIASQQVATKVGFRRSGRGEYFVFDELKHRGGFRPP